MRRPSPPAHLRTPGPGNKTLTAVTAYILSADIMPDVAKHLSPVPAIKDPTTSSNEQNTRLSTITNCKVEWNGLANLRPSDQARVFVTSLQFRTGDPNYRWLNSVVAVVEGVLDSVGGTARVRAFTCEATI